MSFAQAFKNFREHIPLEPFHPVSFDLIGHYNAHSLSRDISSGLTVGMVALPLAMAFAIASGVTPEAGIYTSIIAGFLIAILGGCRVQIGGPAGAFIVIIYGIIANYGLANLMIATIGSGILLFLMGLLKIGSFIRFIPISIVIGFTNGIAVLIALSQVKDFLGLSIEKMPADFFGQMSAIASHIDTVNFYALAIAIISFAIVRFWPKDTSSRTAQWKRWIAKIPGTVIVLIVSTIAVSAQVPDFDWENIRHLVGPMVTIALLGAIESLLCARVADTLTDDRHNPNQELMGQGIANLVVPFFGGIPATGTIARTVTNIKSGAVSPVSGVVHALTLLVVILAAAPLASNIPLAALSAILLNVASNMGNWAEFKRLRRMTMSYKTTLIATFLLTVIFDLTVAVEVGLVISCLFFIYRMNTLTNVTQMTLPADTPEGIEAWRLQGSLFFGSVSKLSYMTDPKRITARNANKVVILNCTALMNIDNSAMDILSTYLRALKRRQFELIICGATGHTLHQLERTGIAQTLGRNMVDNMIDAERLARELLRKIP